MTNGFSFWLSTIYDPTRGEHHAEFWQKLHDLANFGGGHLILFFFSFF